MTENRAPEGQREPTTRDVEAMALDIEECVGLEREYANRIAATLRDLSRKLEGANDRRAEAERFADAIDASARRYGATRDASEHGPERAVALLEHYAASAGAEHVSVTHRAQLFHESEKRKAAEAALEEAERERDEWINRQATAMSRAVTAERERDECEESEEWASKELVRVQARVEALEAALRWALSVIDEWAAGDSDSNGVPHHFCEFVANPEKGACGFHEQYVNASILATPTEPERTEEAGHDEE